MSRRPALLPTSYTRKVSPSDPTMAGDHQAPGTKPLDPLQDRQLPALHQDIFLREMGRLNNTPGKGLSYAMYPQSWMKGKFVGRELESQS